MACLIKTCKSSASFKKIKENLSFHKEGAVMVMAGRWRTPEQVSADVARASGASARGAAGALLYGDRPPPPPRYLRLREDEEVESQRVEGVEGGAGGVGGEGGAGEPDLRGIQHMLRMVEKYGDRGGDVAKPETSKSTKDEDVAIGKLNPRVPAFAPETNGNRIDRVPNETAAEAGRGVDPASVRRSALRVDVPEFVPRAERATAPISSNRSENERRPSLRRGTSQSYNIGESERSSAPAPEPARVPRGAICGDAKHDTRTDDVAVARPPRLRARPALCTPDYFLTALDVRADGDVAATVGADVASTSIALPADAERASRLVGERPDENAAAEALIGDLDEKHVKTSIDKVDDRSESPGSSSAAAPASLFAPFAYERRGAPRSKMPKPAEAAEAAPDATYVPSPHAADLSRRYAARRAADAAADAERGKSVWERLEERLRARDAEIRARSTPSDDS